MSKRVGFFLAAYAAAVAASTVAQSILSSTRDATLPQQTHFNKKIGPGFVCLDSFSTNAKSITKRADYFAFTRRGSHSPIIYDVATKNINNRIMRENGKIFMASHGEMPLAATSTARYLIYWRFVSFRR